MISHFYPVQWFCHDREKHTDDSECRENTWNYPAFHSLLSLHSFHSQRVPFISINRNSISSFESSFHSFHCLSHQCHPSILLYPFHFISTTSIPLPIRLSHHSPLIHTPQQQPKSAATLTIPFVWSQARLTPTIPGNFLIFVSAFSKPILSFIQHVWYL